MKNPNKSSTYIWNDQTIRQAQESIAPSDLDLEFPAGTLQVLRTAFDLQLPRKIVWDLRQLTPPWFEAAQSAARIYKRGVAVMLPPGQSTDQKVAKIDSEIFYQNEIFNFYNLPAALKGKRIFTIIDANLLKHFSLYKPADGLYFYSLHAEEPEKSLHTLAEIITRYRQHPADAFLVIGGGLSLDIGGFAGFLCQKPTHYVPTTLLAMVDAAYGGKTAVNDPIIGKNQIGAFYQPEAIYICQSFLKTLPDRQWLSGAAECIKHLILEGKFAELKDFAAIIAKQDHEALFRLLPDLIQTKINIVERDPLENGERALLNFGHTIAHGLEAALDYQITHGEAVLLGMTSEVLLSQELGTLSQQKVGQILEAFQDSGIGSNEHLRNLLRSRARTLFQDMLPYMQHDKKTANTDQCFLPCILLGQTRGPKGKYVSNIPIVRIAASFLKTLEIFSQN